MAQISKNILLCLGDEYCHDESNSRLWKLHSSGDWKLNLNGSDPEDAIRSAFSCFFVGRVRFIGGRGKMKKGEKKKLSC